MNNKFIRLFIRIVLLPILCGIIYSVSIKYFIRPSEIILTGTEGISIATSYYFQSEKIFIILYAIFQLLLIIFSFIKIDWRFSLKTLITVATVILLLIILPSIKVASPEPENERIVLVLFGSIIMGISKALALKNRGSTGDEDIIAVYFSEKLRKPVGSITVVAGLVALAYGVVINYVSDGNIEKVINTVIYSTVYIYISSETINLIYKRYKFSSLEIITDEIESVKGIITERVPERSYSVTKVTGSYSGKEKNQVVIIVTQEELPGILEDLKKSKGTNFVFYYELQGIQGRFNFSKYISA